MIEDNQNGRGIRWLKWIGRDIQYSIRSLRKDRGSVLLALLALSLGIGATTVIFSIIYSVLVNTFPFKDPSRIVHFYILSPDQPWRSAWYPLPEFLEYRSQNQVFSDVLGGASMEVLYSLENAAYRARGALLDTQALHALGVKPILGRDIRIADGAPDAPPTFLMSDRLWSERFNRDPSLLGKVFRLNGKLRTLIAILPPRFSLHNADVFFPTTIGPGLTEALVNGERGEKTQPLLVWTYARLKPGITPEQAAANIDVIAQSLSKTYPDRYPKQFKVAVVSLADAYTTETLKQMVYILLGAVLMLLLIACSNVANLLLARATARETELAMRASLGASRWRLIQQLLTESFVLAAAGTFIGGCLAYVGLQWAKTAIPAYSLPAEMEIRFSSQALIATIAITMFTTLLCGLVPAFRAARSDLQRRLSGSGKGVGLRTGHGRLRMMLVFVQMTLAIILLVGAGLMMRSLFALQHIELGLNPENVLMGRFAFPPKDQRQTQEAFQTMSVKRIQFVRQAIEKIRALPGVVAASPSFGFPLQQGPSVHLKILGISSMNRPVSALEFVGEDYFRALEIPLASGRLLSKADVDGARKVAVVNRHFVREILGNANPIGQSFTYGDGDKEPLTLFEIVGVVGDTRNSGLQSDILPQAFLPYTIPGIPAESIVMRTSVHPHSLENGVRRQIWAVDPNVALMNVMTLEEALDRDSLAEPKFGAGLLSAFASIGLILSAIGVFSVMAYTVSLQTHDIGIRMAFGAAPGAVVRLILWKGLRPIIAGAVIGVAASYALSRLLASQIYGIKATDPWTFAVSVIVLVAVGAAGCLLPARQAAKVNPLDAVRQE